MVSARDIPRGAEDADDEVATKNRVTWNRWMAPRIPDDLKAVLLKKGYTLHELTPFPDDKLPTTDGISPDAELTFLIPSLRPFSLTSSSSAH